MRKFPRTVKVGNDTWVMKSLVLKKCGLSPNVVPQGESQPAIFYTGWEIHLTVAMQNRLGWSRTIVEFIANPVVEDDNIEKLYNHEMEAWFTGEEAEKIRTRILRVLNLPDELPFWGPAPKIANVEWFPEEVEVILNLPEDSLEHGLEVVRRKMTYQKFGL